MTKFCCCSRPLQTTRTFFGMTFVVWRGARQVDGHHHEKRARETFNCFSSERKVIGVSIGVADDRGSSLLLTTEKKWRRVISRTLISNHRIRSKFVPRVHFICSGKSQEIFCSSFSARQDEFTPRRIALSVAFLRLLSLKLTIFADVPVTVAPPNCRSNDRTTKMRTANKKPRESNLLSFLNFWTHFIRFVRPTVSIKIDGEWNEREKSTEKRSTEQIYSIFVVYFPSSRFERQTN